MSTSKKITDKKQLYILLATAAAVLIAVAGSVIVVDPFFHYHKPLQGFPYVVDNQLSQNPGMAEHFDYDSVIIGSSMTVNFDTDDFAEHMGLNTIKLCYSGAYPKDDANIMEVVLEVQSNRTKDATESSPGHGANALKAVFLPMDLPVMTGDVDEVKYPRPEYLYDDNLLNDVQYILNKDVFLQYVVRPVLNPNPTDLSMVYASWWTDEYYNEEYVRAGHVLPEIAKEEVSRDALIERTEANLRENIIPFLEAAPDTTFYFFYPPYSILYWENVVREKRLEAVLYQTEYVTEQLLQYENVRVFFFQDMEEVVCDLNNYADYTHYHPEVNRYMTQSFATGAHEVKSGEIGGHIDAVRTMVGRNPFF